MLDIDEFFLKKAIISLLWTEFIWETYLSIRQYCKAKSAEHVPSELKHVLTQEEFEKARSYSLAKLRFGFFKDTHSIILSTIVIYNGFLAVLWDYAESINVYPGEVSTSCIWLVVISTLSTIIDLPLVIYETFVLEEKFGFNKQTVGFFVWDKIKAFILTQILGTSICSIIIVVIKNGGEYFFVWLWLVCCVISLVLLAIYPSIIAPLFDKYTPLPEGELRVEIEALAAQLKFPLAQLYIVEGSKRSSHSNAYFYGLFKEKRIVLFDTLLATEDGKKGCQNDEILAVLAHELGHWSKSHVFKNMFLLQINLFLMFAGFSTMFKSPAIYRAIGFTKSQPVLVGLIVCAQYVMIPFNTLTGFLMTILSRKFEFQADEFAVNLKKGEPLQRALIKLHKDNLSFPVIDTWYSTYHYSHPPLLERIAAIQDKARKVK